MMITLTAFLLNQIGKVDKDDFSYDLLNAMGAGLLILYAFLIKSWPFFVLNLIWALISAKDVIVDVKKTRKKNKKKTKKI